MINHIKVNYNEPCSQYYEIKRKPKMSARIKNKLLAFLMVTIGVIFVLAFREDASAGLWLILMGCCLFFSPWNRISKKERYSHLK